MREAPYTSSEARVADYIDKLTGGAIGAGDDPVGFIIASHAALLDRINSGLALAETQCVSSAECKCPKIKSALGGDDDS